MFLISFVFFSHKTLNFRYRTHIYIAIKIPRKNVVTSKQGEWTSENFWMRCPFVFSYTRELSNSRIWGYHLFYFHFPPKTALFNSQCHCPNIKVRPNKTIGKKRIPKRKSFTLLRAHLMNSSKRKAQPSCGLCSCFGVHILIIVYTLYGQRKSQKVYCHTTENFATSFYADVVNLLLYLC